MKVSTAEILRSNHGFDTPEQWIDYAISKNFKAIPAVPKPKCPDCSSEPSGELGQYVYYSNLFRLKTCGKCGLIWANAALDRAVINTHFELTYKNEKYFEESRADIFRHLADLVSKLARQGGSVLDIGGGMGHLMAAVRSIRMDLRLIVQDISEQSLEYAKDQFGLETISGDMVSFGEDRHWHDVVVLSDSLYYEENLKKTLDFLQRSVKSGGAIIIRVPNKLLWIKVAHWFTRWFSSPTRDYIKFFNPEHKYILSRKYLEKCVDQMGFECRVIPSPTLISKNPVKRIAGRLFYRLALVAKKMFDIVITPSMVVVIRNSPSMD